MPGSWVKRIISYNKVSITKGEIKGVVQQR
jgi:hypothetical protein